MNKKNQSYKTCSVKFTQSYSTDSFTVQMASPVWALKGSDNLYAARFQSKTEGDSLKQSNN